MPTSMPLRAQPMPPTPAWRHDDEGDDDPATGLRGVSEDLGVLLAIMLGQDMVAPQSGRGPRAVADRVPPHAGNRPGSCGKRDRCCSALQESADL